MMNISGTTQLIGLFGYPVKHTFSPIIHNAAFTFLGLDFVYIPFSIPPERLNLAMKAIVPLGFKGLNITIPHKETVIPLLDEISPTAELIGAVNTIKIDAQERLIGYNTDGVGFITALLSELNMVIEGKTMVLLGAGGGARAVGIQSALSNLKAIYIMDIVKERAQKLVADIKRSNPKVAAESIEFVDLQSVLSKADILVNATPIGMQPEDPLLIQPEWLNKELKVFDLIYNPLETKLVRTAKERGCSATNGLRMLIEQGAAAFEIWTGIQPPVEIMQQAILDYLARSKQSS
ncbi:MAG: shikimate dehydrogenase [bacterium]|nr:shikimate dehydrogenase [bacterium]